MNILLIEPDITLARIYQQALTTAGHSVTHAAHAQDAVHQADTVKPHVVVLELQLTSHSGVEFLYEFRSYPEWQDVPIVLLTMVSPSSLQITKDMMTTFGIVDCLYKPATNLKQLTSVIDELQ